MIKLFGQDIAKTFYQEKELVAWHTPSNLFIIFLGKIFIMVRTNGTLPYHCYSATNATDARIGCIPTVPTSPYRCVGQFANTDFDLLSRSGHDHLSKSVGFLGIGMHGFMLSD
jgi:hypothetical protein